MRTFVVSQQFFTFNIVGFNSRCVIQKSKFKIKLWHGTNYYLSVVLNK